MSKIKLKINKNVALAIIAIVVLMGGLLINKFAIKKMLKTPMMLISERIFHVYHHRFQVW